MTFKFWKKSSNKVHKFKGGVQSIPANNLGSNDMDGFGDVLVEISFVDFVYVTNNLPFKDQIKRLYFN